MSSRDPSVVFEYLEHLRDIAARKADEMNYDALFLSARVFLPSGSEARTIVRVSCFADGMPIWVETDDGTCCLADQKIRDLAERHGVAQDIPEDALLTDGIDIYFVKNTARENVWTRDEAASDIDRLSSCLICG